MSKKFNFGILIAIATGFSAFISEIENQKKDKKISEMEKRIVALEQKRD